MVFDETLLYTYTYYPQYIVKVHKVLEVTLRMHMKRVSTLYYYIIAVHRARLLDDF